MTFNQCHLTKMQMVTAKTAFLIIFELCIVSDNIVPVLTKSLKKNYCF